MFVVYSEFLVSAGQCVVSQSCQAKTTDCKTNTIDLQSYM